MSIRPLLPSDLDKAISLQDIVMTDLALKGQARFIIPRSPDYFAEHIEKPHGMIGFWQDDNLMAQAIMRHHNEQYDMTAYTGLPSLPRQEDGHRVSILQGVLVHPDFRGQGVMEKLIGEWLGILEENGIEHALSRIEVSHRRSWRNFMKQGFALTNIVKDARDGASVYIAHRRRGDAADYPDSVSCAATDIEGQLIHMQNGASCVAYSKDDDVFVMAKAV